MIYTLFILNQKGHFNTKFLTLLEMSASASKTPKKENPTNSPKVPPSSATCYLRVAEYIIYCKCNSLVVSYQRGQRVDELFHLVPVYVGHQGHL